jgi:NADP-dependent 3-hydroxy acid dehydrogenase YdfG
VPGPLEGRAAAVTGASSGIGAATARALAAAGASVAAVGRRRERLEALGANAVVAADLRVAPEAQAVVARAQRELGRLDVLVNCAGCLHPGRVEAGNADDWREMTEVNLLAAVNCSYAAIRAMRENGGGHIVNVSSVVARMPLPEWGVYSATKAGLSAFSAALRAELLADNIHVTLVEPGFTDTEMTAADAVRPVVEALRAQRGTGLLQPSDVAEAIVFAVTRPARMTLEEMVLRPFQAAS